MEYVENQGPKSPTRVTLLGSNKKKKFKKFENKSSLEQATKITKQNESENSKTIWEKKTK